MPYKIFTDSSCDLTVETLNKLGIGFISYYVNVGADALTYLKDMVDISAREFYEIMKKGDVWPKTSMPPIGDYTDAFKTALDDGQDILCVTLTQKFSTSYASALNAREILLEEYPDRKIFVVDSKTVAGVQGLMVLEAARMLKDGVPLETAAQKLTLMKEQSMIYITVDSLKYLQKGGRIGKVASLAGTLLNIKPIIVMKDGELVPMSMVRGRKKTIAELMSLFETDIGAEKEKYSLALLHGDAYDEALDVKSALAEKGYDFPDPMYVGVTIGSHIGPTVIGIGYIKKYEYV
ncbi:hypothetical protein FACS189490_06200 [Clostridia bacterium]|nr:hypothetical protein FACS189490_06200 [Clostridia bacterium]